MDADRHDKAPWRITTNAKIARDNIDDDDYNDENIHARTLNKDFSCNSPSFQSTRPTGVREDFALGRTDL